MKILLMDWNSSQVASALHRRARPANRQARFGLAAFSRLEGARTLLDVGGGDGTLSEGFLRFYPQLKVTLLDRAPSIRLACRRLRRNGLSGRVELRVADILKDDLGRGYDACLVSRVIRFFTEDQGKRLLRRAWCSLRDGGRLILHDEFSRSGDRAPAFRKGSAPSWKIWSVFKIQSWLSEVGFGEIQEAIPGQLILATKSLGS